LKPPTRCFSEWPIWLDQKLPQLAGKRVMMYCTGGVRCERASAYLRSKGELYTRVEQLKGVSHALFRPMFGLLNIHKAQGTCTLQWAGHAACCYVATCEPICAEICLEQGLKVSNLIE
jgi:hypothetical protein